MRRAVTTGRPASCWVREALPRNISREPGLRASVRRETCTAYVHLHAREELTCSCDFPLGSRIAIEGGCSITGPAWVSGCEVADRPAPACSGNPGMSRRCHCVRLGELGGRGGFGRPTRQRFAVTSCPNVRVPSERYMHPDAGDNWTGSSPHIRRLWW